MSPEERIAEIHTLVTYWNEHGFPQCHNHGGRIDRIEKDVGRHDKIIWGAAAFMAASLASLVIGGCI
jgi:hypothetical protein